MGQTPMKAICALMLVWATSANAAELAGESPRSGTLEFKLGSYLPNIDSSLKGAPYQTIFGQGGKNPAMLMFNAELDWMLWQKLGTISVGVSGGYAEKVAPALVASSSGGATTQSAEKTSLVVYPLEALAAYRLDYAARNWGVPLVPYVKLGFLFIPYAIYKGSSIDSIVNKNGQTVNGSGGRYGLGITGGLSFMLDVLEPRMARDFDTDLGINHSYLFAEFSDNMVNSFGRPGLNLGSQMWSFGLAFDF